MNQISIHIGELHASKEPTVIYTLLGSCVAVCLHDPVERIGGMNHILLPGRADLKRFDTVARYGINAMELLINRIMALGGKRSRLVAKVFGGAHVLPTISRANGVGIKNIEFVLDFMQIESIPVVGKDLGGEHTRKVYFQTHTGAVLLKRITRETRPRIKIEEHKMLDKMRKEVETAGEITFFT